MRLGNLDEMVGVVAVIALLSGCSTMGRPVPIAGLVSDNDDPDAEVRDFRIGPLTARIRLMTPGVERDYYSGILASRSARTEESLLIGEASVVLRNIQIVPARTNSGLDVLFGNLGQDFVDGFKSFTLDFVEMTFSVET